LAHELLAGDVLHNELGGDRFGRLGRQHGRHGVAQQRVGRLGVLDKGLAGGLVLGVECFVVQKVLGVALAVFALELAQHGEHGP